jgi:hypothetical protein
MIQITSELASGEVDERFQRSKSDVAEISFHGVTLEDGFIVGQMTKPLQTTNGFQTTAETT